MKYAKVIQIETIERTISLQNKQSELKRQLALLEDVLKEAEAGVIEQIQNGYATPSEYKILVKEQERRYPSWKDAFISSNGKQAADELIQSTSPTICYKVCISSVGQLIKEAA